MSGQLGRVCHVFGKQTPTKISGGLWRCCILRDSIETHRNIINIRNFGRWQDNCRSTCLHRTRSVSKINTFTSVPFATYSTTTTDIERQKFVAVFSDIVNDLTDFWTEPDISEVQKWLSKVLHYNVTDGKKTRGLTLVHSYQMLSRELSAENIRLAQIMGWCVEMLQAFFIVLDDIMDKSATRRGKVCWYLHNNIGLAAVNDGLLLESGLYHLLQKYFQDKPYYVKVLQLFHNTTFKTTMGQSLDLLTSQAGRKPDYTKFTMDRYSAIVKYKTAYYSFYLPIALSMLMAGIQDPEVHRQTKTILLEMGHLFQVQDDYLDCFGDPELIGKTGSDIVTGKCSWLAVIALQRATRQQRILFEECYASEDVRKAAAVKELYEQLGICSIYVSYEELTYKMINTHIQQLSNGVPHHLFTKFLKEIYRRGS